VHWHGLRLENIYEGTHQTQAPIPVGESFAYRLRFPDPGLYWYHPHIRQDYGQEMGLYGNILVVPAEADYWPPAHREVLLTLDDILLEDGKVAPFSHHETNYVAMRRFGTTLLVAGAPELALNAKLGEVVRFYLTDTANTRVFKVGVKGAKMKLVGGDGHVEREEFVEDVILVPSERVVVDVLFDTPGPVTLEHRTPERTYALADITVVDERAEPDLTEQFEAQRVNEDLSAERERIAPHLEADPDKTLAFVAEVDMGEPEIEAGTAVYACPMHAEIVATWEGKCPICGMKLVVEPTGMGRPTTFACPMHPEITATWAGTCPKCGMTLRPTEAGGEMPSTKGTSITARITRTMSQAGSSGKTTWSR
jgi:FtsP/CotA-like multicopper oxidase with cupredoxin domain